MKIAYALGIIDLATYLFESNSGSEKCLCAGVTQADLADGLPLKLSQRVSEDTVSEAFAQCNSDETPVAGECIVVQGNGLMFNAGIQLNQEHGHDGYHCLYTGSPTVRAYAYCVNKKQIRIIPLGANP